MGSVNNIETTPSDHFHCFLPLHPGGEELDCWAVFLVEFAGRQWFSHGGFMHRFSERTALCLGGCTTGGTCDKDGERNIKVNKMRTRETADGRITPVSMVHFGLGN